MYFWYQTNECSDYYDEGGAVHHMEHALSSGPLHPAVFVLDVL